MTQDTTRTLGLRAGANAGGDEEVGAVRRFKADSEEGRRLAKLLEAPLPRSEQASWQKPVTVPTEPIGPLDRQKLESEAATGVGTTVAGGVGRLAASTVFGGDVRLKEQNAALADVSKGTWKKQAPMAANPYAMGFPAEPKKAELITHTFGSDDAEIDAQLTKAGLDPQAIRASAAEEARRYKASGKTPPMSNFLHAAAKWAADEELAKRADVKRRAAVALKEGEKWLGFSFLGGGIRQLPLIGQYSVGAKLAGPLGLAFPLLASYDRRYADLRESDFEVDPATGLPVETRRGLSAGEAEGPAMAGAALETAVEVGLGKALSLVGKPLAKLTGLDKASAKALEAAPGVRRFLKNFDALAKYTQIQGYPTEVVEEGATQIIDAGFGLTPEYRGMALPKRLRKGYEDFRDNAPDLLLSMLLLQAGQGAVSLARGNAQGRAEKAAGDRLSALLTPEQLKQVTRDGDRRAVYEYVAGLSPAEAGGILDRMSARSAKIAADAKRSAEWMDAAAPLEGGKAASRFVRPSDGQFVSSGDGFWSYTDKAANVTVSVDERTQRVGVRNNETGRTYEVPYTGNTREAPHTGNIREALEDAFRFADASDVEAQGRATVNAAKRKALKRVVENAGVEGAYVILDSDAAVIDYLGQAFAADPAQADSAKRQYAAKYADGVTPEGFHITVTNPDGTQSRRTIFVLDNIPLGGRADPNRVAQTMENVFRAASHETKHAAAAGAGRDIFTRMYGSADAATRMALVEAGARRELGDAASAELEALKRSADDTPETAAAKDAALRRWFEEGVAYYTEGGLESASRGDRVRRWVAEKLKMTGVRDERAVRVLTDRALEASKGPVRFFDPADLRPPAAEAEEAPMRTDARPESVQPSASEAAPSVPPRRAEAAPLEPDLAAEFAPEEAAQTESAMAAEDALGDGAEPEQAPVEPAPSASVQPSMERETPAEPEAKITPAGSAPVEAPPAGEDIAEPEAVSGNPPEADTPMSRAVAEARAVLEEMPADNKWGEVRLRREIGRVARRHGVSPDALRSEVMWAVKRPAPEGRPPSMTERKPAEAPPAPEQARERQTAKRQSGREGLAEAKRPGYLNADGSKKVSAANMALVEEAQRKLRDVINNPDIVGRQRADMIENGRNLIGFLSTTSELETGYRNGDKIAYTGVDTPDGFREFIYLEGAKAGEYGQIMSKAEKDAAVGRKQREFQEEQDGFRRIREAQESKPSEPPTKATAAKPQPAAPPKQSRAVRERKAREAARAVESERKPAEPPPPEPARERQTADPAPVQGVPSETGGTTADGFTEIHDIAMSRLPERFRGKAEVTAKWREAYRRGKEDAGRQILRRVEELRAKNIRSKETGELVSDAWLLDRAREDVAEFAHRDRRKAWSSAPDPKFKLRRPVRPSDFTQVLYHAGRESAAYEKPAPPTDSKGRTPEQVESLKRMSAAVREAQKGGEPMLPPTRPNEARAKEDGRPAVPAVQKPAVRKDVENVAVGDTVIVKSAPGYDPYVGTLVSRGAKNLRVRTRSSMYGEQVIRLPAGDLEGFVPKEGREVKPAAPKPAAPPKRSAAQRRKADAYQAKLAERRAAYAEQARGATEEELRATLADIGDVPAAPEDGIDLMRKRAIEDELARRAQAPSATPALPSPQAPASEVKVETSPVEMEVGDEVYFKTSPFPDSTRRVAKLFEIDGVKHAVIDGLKDAHPVDQLAVKPDSHYRKLKAEKEARIREKAAKRAALVAEIEALPKVTAVSPLKDVEAGTELRFWEDAPDPRMQSERWGYMRRSEHAQRIEEAFVGKRPVSAAGAEAYKLNVPEGYMRDGELLVYRPSGNAASEVRVETAPDGDKTVSVPSKDTPAIAPREQKRYLLAEIDKAIETAPSDRYESEREDDYNALAKRLGLPRDEFWRKRDALRKGAESHVLIQVPGDGEFRIVNTLENLWRFKAAVEKRFPEKKMPSSMPHFSRARPELSGEADWAIQHYGDAAKAADRIEAGAAQEGVEPEEAKRYLELAKELRERAALTSDPKMQRTEELHTARAAKRKAEDEALNAKFQANLAETRRKALEALKKDAAYGELKALIESNGSQPIPPDGDLLNVQVTGKGAPAIRKLQDEIAKRIGVPERIKNTERNRRRFLIRQGEMPGTFPLSRYYGDVATDFTPEAEPDEEAQKEAETPIEPVYTRTTPEKGTPERAAIDEAAEKANKAWEAAVAAEEKTKREYNSKDYGTAIRARLEKKLAKDKEATRAAWDAWEAAAKPAAKADAEDDALSDDPLKRLSGLKRLGAITGEQFDERSRKLYAEEFGRRGLTGKTLERAMFEAGTNTMTYRGLTEVADVAEHSATEPERKKAAVDEVSAWDNVPDDFKARAVERINKASIWPQDLNRLMDEIRNRKPEAEERYRAEQRAIEEREAKTKAEREAFEAPLRAEGRLFYIYSKESGWTPVEGDALKIPALPWVGTLFVRQAGKKMWIVSESRTGLRIAEAESRLGAVNAAKAKLAAMGEEKFGKIVADVVKDLSPRPDGAPGRESPKLSFRVSPEQTETPEFKRWFGESKVVDADGGAFSPTNPDIRFRVVTDPALIAELDAGPTIKVFRAAQVIDGKLYPPMSAKIGGVLRPPIELGKWEQAVESPHLVSNGKFKLDKANKAVVPAAYNPYIHTSRSPLNDQFSSAYKRPNLVTLEVEVPASELNSGYKAEGAKDSVGELSWHSGPVSSKLPKHKERKVILTRYDKPVRIVPDSEVAEHIARLLEGENLTVPSTVVTPSLGAELVKRGVRISDTESSIRFRVHPSAPGDEVGRLEAILEAADSREFRRPGSKETPEGVLFTNAETLRELAALTGREPVSYESVRRSDAFRAAVEDFDDGEARSLLAKYSDVRQPQDIPAADHWKLMRLVEIHSRHLAALMPDIRRAEREGDKARMAQLLESREDSYDVVGRAAQIGLSGDAYAGRQLGARNLGFDRYGEPVYRIMREYKRSGRMPTAERVEELVRQHAEDIRKIQEAKAEEDAARAKAMRETDAVRDRERDELVEKAATAYARGAAEAQRGFLELMGRRELRNARRFSFSQAPAMTDEASLSFRAKEGAAVQEFPAPLRELARRIYTETRTKGLGYVNFANSFAAEAEASGVSPQIVDAYLDWFLTRAGLVKLDAPEITLRRPAAKKGVDVSDEEARERGARPPSDAARRAAAVREAYERAMEANPRAAGSEITRAAVANLAGSEWAGLSERDAARIFLKREQADIGTRTELEKRLEAVKVAIETENKAKRGREAAEASARRRAALWKNRVENARKGIFPEKYSALPPKEKTAKQAEWDAEADKAREEYLAIVAGLEADEREQRRLAKEAAADERAWLAEMRKTRAYREARRTMLLARKAEALERRLASGDFAAPARRERVWNTDIALAEDRVKTLERSIALRVEWETNEAAGLSGRLKNLHRLGSDVFKYYKASWDASALGVQNVRLFQHSPLYGSKAFVQSLIHAVSEERAAELRHQLEQHPDFRDAFGHGLAHSRNYDDYFGTGSAEVLFGQWERDLRASDSRAMRWTLGTVVKGVNMSQRAFTAYGDMMRLHVYSSIVNHPANSAISDEGRSAVANMVNILSGVGNTRSYSPGLAKTLSELMWSSRLFTSQWQTAFGGAGLLWNAGAGPKLSREALGRKWYQTAAPGAIRTYARIAAGNFALMALFEAMGRAFGDRQPWEDEEEWFWKAFSFLFGPRRVAGTTVDFSGRLTPWFAMARNVISDSHISPSGRTVPDDGWRSWALTFANFGRGRLRPEYGLVVSMLAGETIAGEPFGPFFSGEGRRLEGTANMIKETALPIAVGDMIDSGTELWRTHGPLGFAAGIVPVAAINLFGFAKSSAPRDPWYEVRRHSSHLGQYDKAVRAARETGDWGGADELELRYRYDISVRRSVETFAKAARREERTMKDGSLPKEAREAARVRRDEWLGLARDTLHPTGG